MSYFLLISLLIVAILLILVVLLQKGRGGGLGAAFGGGGAGSAFGTRTGDVLTWITICLTVLFLGLTMLAVHSVRPPRQQVAAPVISPAGPITSRTVAQITCETPKAKIRYTLNGKAPTKQSPAYSSGVKVRPGDILKAKAFLAGMDESEMTEVKYLTPEEAAKAAAEKAKADAKKLLDAAKTTTQPAAPATPALPTK